MAIIKRIGKHPKVRGALAGGFAAYLRFVRRTTRFTLEPADAHERYVALAPVVIAMWHGQHLMIPFFRRPGYRAVGLVSRSSDGELNAQVLEKLGIGAIRGSGDRGRGRIREKGGAQALRGMVRTLAEGTTVVLTADVPKISRVAGPGIVTLARMSGRPILPIAIVTKRHFSFRSWDRATLGLPFGPGAIVLGEPILVPREADEADLEAARLAVQEGLDAVHARAYALVGARDPGRRAERDA